MLFNSYPKAVNISEHNLFTFFSQVQLWEFCEPFTVALLQSDYKNK